MEPSTSDIDDKDLKLAVEIDGRYSGKIPDWRRDDDKRFEAALENVGYSPDKIPQIAELLNKTVEEVKYYYEALFYDIQLIESGLVKTNYAEYTSSPSPTSDILVNEKKRGKNWSEEEHRAFLEGLEERGKGDWKNISRDYVRTRTPTQVASHAQKYYKRQAEQTDETDGTKKKKKRSSIHDITSVGTSSVTIPPRPGSDSVSHPQNQTIPPGPQSHLASVSQPHNQTIPPMFGLDYVSQPQNHTIPPQFGSDSLSQPENHTILPRSDWDYLSQPHHQQMLPQQCSYFDDLAEFL